MSGKRQSGFSLIELLLVVVVIGVVASLAVPALQKGIWAAQSGSTIGTLRSISSTQLSYFTQNGRFGRLIEINNVLGGGIGTAVGNEIIRGKYVFSMFPDSPGDAELRVGYTILATRDVRGDGPKYVYELTQSGEIRQILP